MNWDALAAVATALAVAVALFAVIRSEQGQAIREAKRVLEQHLLMAIEATQIEPAASQDQYGSAWRMVIAGLHVDRNALEPIVQGTIDRHTDSMRTFDLRVAMLIVILRALPQNGNLHTQTIEIS